MYKANRFSSRKYECLNSPPLLGSSRSTTSSSHHPLRKQTFYRQIEWLSYNIPPSVYIRSISNWKSFPHSIFRILMCAGLFTEWSAYVRLSSRHGFRRVAAHSLYTPCILFSDPLKAYTVYNVKEKCRLGMSIENNNILFSRLCWYILRLPRSRSCRTGWISYTIYIIYKATSSSSSSWGRRSA